jgi:PST family polysaccharide transporter
MKWLSQMLTWGCTIVVARILTPADYGLVGMALLYLQLVMLVNELGLGAAVVTRRELTSDQIAQLNSLSVVLGVAGFLVSCLAALPVSLFFDSPELRWVILVMSGSCIVTAFRAVPSALLERDLRFKVLAITEGSQAIVSAASTLVLALTGFGYWALVLGRLVGWCSWTGMILWHRTHHFARPRLRTLLEPLTFSSHLLVSRLAWYAQTNGDFLVAGRVLGKELLGAYAMAFTLASVPLEKITSTVGRVTFPFLASIQHDSDALRRYLLLLTKSLALVTFPLGLGIALVADTLVLGVLGEEWREAITPLRCLAVLILLQSVSSLLPHILNVTGDSRFNMRVGAVAAILLPLSFYVGSRWGIVGIAAVWIAVYPFTRLPLYWRVFRRLQVSAGAYLAAVWPAISGSLAMATTVWVLRLSVSGDWSMLASLALQVAGGGTAYLLLVGTAHREHFRAFHRAVQIMRGAKA